MSAPTSNSPKPGRKLAASGAFRGDQQRAMNGRMLWSGFSHSACTLGRDKGPATRSPGLTAHRDLPCCQQEKAGVGAACGGTESEVYDGRPCVQCPRSGPSRLSVRLSDHLIANTSSASEAIGAHKSCARSVILLGSSVPSMSEAYQACTASCTSTHHSSRQALRRSPFPVCDTTCSVIPRTASARGHAGSDFILVVSIGPFAAAWNRLTCVQQDRRSDSFY